MARHSFRLRLIAGAAIWISVGLAMSWFAVVDLFRTHVTSEFVDELDHHGTELAGLIEYAPGKPIAIRQPLSDRRFFIPRSGYYWQIDLPDGGGLRSGSLESAHLPADLRFDSAPPEHNSVHRGPTGEALMLERILPAKGDRPALRVTVATDRAQVEAVLADLRHTFAFSLVFIAAGLIGAAMAQVTIGLLPLNRVRDALAAIRRGAASRLPEDLPSEVAPLASSVNALLGANEEVVRRARIQAGNLAHALKTPIAVMMGEANRLQAAGLDGSLLLEQCQKMRRQIDYELAKARAAASRESLGLAAPLAPAIGAVVSALERLYHDKPVRFDVEIAEPDAIVTCDREDLEEILGNLVDNAAKWSRGHVLVIAGPAGAGRIRLAVEDDGPGMPVADRERVFRAGERLDEQIPGTGLGLAIVRDIAELYGGAAWIEDGGLGGIRACVELPAFSPAS